MTFVGGNKRPVDIIRYVIKHGISQEGQASSTPDSEKRGEVSGTTGFLCWQTLDGYRFASVDDVLNARGGDDKGEYTYRIQNNASLITTRCQLRVSSCMTSNRWVTSSPSLGQVHSKAQAGQLQYGHR